MSILARYVAGDFLKYLFSCLMAMVLLLLVANLFGNIESVFASWRKFVDFAESMARAIPTIIEIVLPMSVLLATVITFSGFSRSSELVAMKSTGMGLIKLTLPVLIILVPVSGLAYLNQNYLYNALHRDEDRNTTSVERNEWRSEGNKIYYFRSIDSARNSVQGGRIYRWSDQPFRLAEILKFAGGRQSESGWELQQITRREQIAGTWKAASDSRLLLGEGQFPDVFKPAVLDAHHMPLFDLNDRIRQLEKRSPQLVAYLLEWYQKIAVLFAPFVMVLVGVPLSQSHARKARVAGEIVITMFGGIVFWISNEIFLILGKAGAIPPFWSAWGVNILFALLGIALLMRGR